MSKKRKLVARKRRLDAAVQAIQQKWGTQAIHKGKSSVADSAVPCLPTGLLSLDRILSTSGNSGTDVQEARHQGGLPLGHISEMIGQPTSGKRTLALRVLAHTQRRHPCVYIDLAQTFDPAYAAACKVDLSRLSIATPANPRQALNLIGDLTAGGHFALIVFDSTAELLTEAMPESATAAMLRRLLQTLHGKHCVLLFLTTPFFGEADSAHNYPAGFNLAQAAALRLLIDRDRWLRRRDGNIQGYEAQVKVLRHRWGRVGRQTSVQITFNGVHVQSPDD
ncbi:MAG: hypothetical protein U9R25_14390 [Chloroflexota bacterium]|nr:hypothetical protein [Chloroflexota bacterium]